MRNWFFDFRAAGRRARARVRFTFSNGGGSSVIYASFRSARSGGSGTLSSPRARARSWDIIVFDEFPSSLVRDERDRRVALTDALSGKPLRRDRGNGLHKAAHSSRTRASVISRVRVEIFMRVSVSNDRQQYMYRCIYMWNVGAAHGAKGRQIAYRILLFSISIKSFYCRYKPRCDSFHCSKV